MKTSTLSLLAPHGFRKSICLCLTVVMLISIAVIAPVRTAAAAPNDWVRSFISADMAKKYGTYNNVQGLPAKFANYAQTQNNQFYYSTLDYHAIYCIEIDQHSWYPNPDESDTSPLFPGTNTSKQRMLAYVLANGQRFFGEDENSVKNFTATQIAVWIIAEGHLNDNTILDLILYPALGTPPDGTAFAPTLEVGRLARQLLDGATAFAASAADMSTLLDPIIPSFTSFDEATAQTFTMQNAGSFYETEVVDNNGVVGRDWPNLLKVADAGGLLVIDGVQDNALSVRGTPQQETTIKLTGPYGGYQLRYLSTTVSQPNGQPFQNMARLARLDGEVPVYFKVALDATAGQMTGLDLSKTIAGNGDVAKEFQFTANFKTVHGIDVSGILLNGAEFNNGDTFTLKHGAAANFTNIPVGTEYEIIESDYLADGYTSDKANNAVKGAATNQEHIAVSYTNAYNGSGSNNGTNKGLPQAGDNTLPAYVALAMVLSGLAIIGFWLRKRYTKRSKE
ncbi:hypothetical protein FACS1894104_0660 [Actinomycetota bacterium]|nr:hypothetical protein FACS1894104_0660 [Actinomycetota bacterium]